MTMTEHRIVLQGAPAVRALRASLRFSRPKAVVQLSCDALTEDERRWWEARLSRYYPACGCSLGAALMSVTTLAGAADLLRRWWTTAVLSWKAVLFVVMATLAAAIIGKIVGLLLGHVRMSRALRALELRLGRAHAAATRP